VNDDDNGGLRDAKMAWKAQVDDSWQYPYRLGAGRLVGPESVAVGASQPVSGQVLLQWPHYSWNTAYEVHRSASPYFTPGVTTRVDIVPAPGHQYPDTPPPGAWYYLIRAIQNGLGVDSNQTGKFDFSLSAP